MKKIFTLLWALCLFFEGFGQACLVKVINPFKDFNNNNVIIQNAEISNIYPLGNKVIFNANDGVHGFELWVSDGTEVGTFMLKDIYVGDKYASGYPSNFVKNNNIYTFTATDGEKLNNVLVTKLYRTDGTPKGTFQISTKSYNDYELGVYSPRYPTSIVNVDTLTYWLVGDNPLSGDKRFYPNGGVKPIGDMLILKDLNNNTFKSVLDKNISPEIIQFTSSLHDSVRIFYDDNKKFDYFPSFGSNTYPKTSTDVLRFGDKWLFNAVVKDGFSIFLSDGTTKGTEKIFTAKNRFSFIKANTPSGLLAFFALDDGINGKELWKTDGTASGTKIVKNIGVGNLSSIKEFSNENVFAVTKGIVFKTNDGVWFSDGTDVGTIQLKNTFNSPFPSTIYPENPFMKGFNSDDKLNKNVFFLNILSPNYKIELWGTDGTVSGTKLIADNVGDIYYLQYLRYYGKDEPYLYGFGYSVFKINTDTNVLSYILNPSNGFDFYSQYSTGGKFAGNNVFGVGSDANGRQLWKIALPTVSCSHTAKINTPNGTSFCGTNSVIITAEGTGTTSPFTYKWKQGTTEVGVVASLTVNKRGTYTVEITDKNGCVVSTSVDITNTTLPATITGSNSFCAGQTTTLTATATGGTSPFTYQWKQGTTNVGTASTLAVNAVGNYTVSITDSKGCTGTSTAYSVTQTTSLPVSITGANSFCAGQNTTLTANATGGVSPYTYQWKQGTDKVGTNLNTFLASAVGSYSVDITDSKGCTGTSTAYPITQKISPNVVVSKSGSVDLLPSATVVLSVVSATGQTYQWNKEGVAISGATTNSYSATLAGSYTVTVTGGGCSATSEAVVVNLITAIEEEPNATGIQVEVSPNPTQELCQIKIDLLKPAKVSLQLRDISGKSLQEQTMNNPNKHHETAFDFSVLPAGVYLIQVNVDDKQVVKKVIRQ